MINKAVELNKEAKMNVMNFPNCLTLLRISLIPILVLVFYLPFKFHNLVAVMIFIVASFTDWLDGYLARKFKQETKFGEFFDPVADKLIVVVALLLILETFSTYLISIPAMIIISREIVVSGLREWMAKLGQSNIVSVTYVGKLKTTFQMAAIAVLLSVSNINSPSNMDWVNFLGLEASKYVTNLGLMLLFLASALTIWSMLVYLYSAWPILMAKTKKF